MRETYVTIDTGRLREIYRYLLGRLPEGCALTAVVKANAYGFGSVEVSRIALEEGASSLAVAIAEEAAPIRAAGITAPIYILGLSNASTFDLIAETGAIPAICGATDLRALQEAAERYGKTIDCTVAVDTGMHRIGIAPEEALSFLERTDAYPNVNVIGFFSHMATADAPEREEAAVQIGRLLEMKRTVAENRTETYEWSMSNSAGIVHYPESHFDRVRAGIIQYGVWPSETDVDRESVKAVLSWHAEVVHVQHLEPGESVGYGLSYTAERSVVIATVAVGYADGYSRRFSNGAPVLIGGVRGRVAGRVCMDQLMVELPADVSVRPGDEAVLIGTQGGETILVEELAEIAGTIPYELFCAISSRVPRRYI